MTKKSGHKKGGKEGKGEDAPSSARDDFSEEESDNVPLGSPQEGPKPGRAYANKDEEEDEENYSSKKKSTHSPDSPVEIDVDDEEEYDYEEPEQTAVGAGKKQRGGKRKGNKGSKGGKNGKGGKGGEGEGSDVDDNEVDAAIEEWYENYQEMYEREQEEKKIREEKEIVVDPELDLTDLDLGLDAGDVEESHEDHGYNGKMTG
eukprot:GHVU01105718.1.p2 GENE.GHVU01105718.1~~GHVU01105718.1.p2  ORF type:complete len:203 (+),score=62.05 GHVU01105718.1:1722-2330(+)